MKSRVCLSLVLLLVGILGGSPSVLADVANPTHYVSKTGSNTSPYETPAKASTDIQSAIDVATAGDTVEVADETYTENITMKSGVAVKSAGDNVTETDYATSLGYTVNVLQRAAQTIINGTVECTATTATLDGFTIQNTGPATVDPLVKISGIGSPTIQNCIIRSTENSGGIGIVGGSPEIYSNVIDNVGGPGIRLEGGSPTIGGKDLGNSILGNLGAGISSKPDGLTGDATIVIQGNIIKQNMAGGIWLERAGGAAGTIDVTIGDDDIPPSDPGLGNLITLHGGLAPAVALHGLTTAIIRHNIIQDNTSRVGMFLSSDAAAGVMTAVLQRNTFQNCQRAVCIVGACLTTIGGPLDFDGNFTEANTFDNNAVAGVVFGNGEVGPFTPGPISSPVVIQGNDMSRNGSPTGAAIVVGDMSVLAVDIPGSITVEQNRIHNNYAGIRVMNPCASLNITKNNIHTNVMAGVAAGDVSSRTCPGLGCANLTVTQNRIHHNGSGGAAGCNVIDASGVVTNNLFYKNSYAGLVFGEFVTSIINNTSVAQTGYTGYGGAGIKYFKISDTDTDCTTLGGDIPYPPAIDIKNNILAYNAKAGFGICTSGPPGDCDVSNMTKRDYNLLYLNNQTVTDCMWSSPDAEQGLDRWCVEKNYGGCGATDVKPFELLSVHDIIADPLFVNEAGDDYRLQAGSPAMTGGDPVYGSEMGAYGGGSGGTAPLVDAEIPPDA
jgi:hypothetical protein